jgi:hypothetical protein
MGNTIYSSSQPTDMKSLASHIDDIAVHYILKQNTIDILRLTDKEYYDNLIVLVGNLFEKKLSDIEIGSLNQRIFPETVQDSVTNLLPTNGKIKDVMIRNISKFYIKIMMIFSAIVSTIDPQYAYDDDTGKKQLFYLKDIKSYKNIPKNVQPVVHQLTNPMNLCRKRISILRNKIESSDPDFITINPGEKLCSTESAGYLTDEIGIKELDLLYYDIFDPETKTWKGRSKHMDEKYKQDLNKFYTIFTGKAELPPNVNSFKDIELFDFRSIDYCKDTLFTHDFIIPKDNELIIRYKEQVDLLEQSTTIYRAELLETLKKLFLTKIENENMTYTIQPTLTLQDILNIENETRNTIINLYTNCEQYFIRALLIFEELYDNQSKNMNESRMNNLDRSIPMNQNQPLYKEGMFNVNSGPQPIPPLNMSQNVNMNIKSELKPEMNPNENVMTRPSNTPNEMNGPKEINEAYSLEATNSIVQNTPIPSLEAPSDKPNTLMPSLQPSPEAPSDKPNTPTPSLQPSPEAPSDKPSTPMPSLQPSLEAPSDKPNTLMPSLQPSPEAPSDKPSTPMPSLQPSPEAPSDKPSTPMPSLQPSLEAPLIVPKTLIPPPSIEPSVPSVPFIPTETPLIEPLNKPEQTPFTTVETAKIAEGQTPFTTAEPAKMPGPSNEKQTVPLDATKEKPGLVESIKKIWS